MNYIEVEGVVALSNNKQCHSRESGNLVLEMRYLIKEVPAFLRMDALMSREHMDVRSDRGDDIASRTALLFSWQYRHRNAPPPWHRDQLIPKIAGLHAKSAIERGRKIGGGPENLRIVRQTPARHSN